MVALRCLGTSPYANPGKGHALSSDMPSESASHQFPLFPAPILLDTGAPEAPQLSFSCSLFLRRGAQKPHADMQPNTKSYRIPLIDQHSGSYGPPTVPAGHQMRFRVGRGSLWSPTRVWGPPLMSVRAKNKRWARICPQKVFPISSPSFPPPSCSTQARLGPPNYLLCGHVS